MIRGRPRWLVPLGVIAVLSVVAVGGGLIALGIVRGPTTTSVVGPPRYVEETASAGIDQTFDGPLAYFIGGGLAVFDCNGDGRQDVFVAGGENPAILYRNDSPVGGALRFAAVHDSATDLPAVEGAYPLDQLQRTDDSFLHRRRPGGLQARFGGGNVAVIH